MDVLTRGDLESLTAADGAGVQISLVMPTHRFGSELPADQLRWKNLLAGVESELAEQMRRPAVEALLQPARALHQDAEAWEHMSDGLAMFVRPGWDRTFRVPARVPELGAVGDRLVLGPLLRLLSGDERFLLLALSRHRIRLLEGSRDTVTEVRLTDVPTSLREVVPAHEPRSATMARPAAGATRGGPAVFYGHGAGNEHLKQDELLRFLRQVAAGLQDVLATRRSPMVLVGLEQLVATYRGVSSYGHLLEDAVIRSSDELSAEELHRLAWPVVEQSLREEQAEALERLRGLHGTGRVSTTPRTLREAALHGRVETLFVRADPWCWEQVSTGSPAVVRLGADDRYTDCEDVDVAAAATLSGGGKVYATTQQVAADSEVAGVLRY